MLLEVNDEAIERAFCATLRNSLDSVKTSLAENNENKTGSGTFSYDYKEDTERLLELKQSLKVTLDWFKEHE